MSRGQSRREVQSKIGGDAESYMVSQNDMDNDTFFQEEPNLISNLGKRGFHNSVAANTTPDILQESP